MGRLIDDILQGIGLPTKIHEEGYYVLCIRGEPLRDEARGDKRFRFALYGKIENGQLFVAGLLVFLR